MQRKRTCWLHIFACLKSRLLVNIFLVIVRNVINKSEGTGQLSYVRGRDECVILGATSVLGLLIYFFLYIIYLQGGTAAWILGAFINGCKKWTGPVMTASTRIRGRIGLLVDGFSWNCMWGLLRKSANQMQCLLKCNKSEALCLIAFVNLWCRRILRRVERCKLQRKTCYAKFFRNTCGLGCNKKHGRASDTKHVVDALKYYGATYGRYECRVMKVEIQTGLLLDYENWEGMQ